VIILKGFIMTTKLEQNQEYKPPMVGLKEAYKSYWLKAFCWRGRSTRAEFWWPTLVNLIILTLLGTALTLTQLVLVLDLYYLFLIIILFPTFSIIARRSHDIGIKAYFSLFCIAFALIRYAPVILRIGISNFSGLLLVGLGLVVRICYITIGLLPSQNFPNKYGDPR